MLARLTLGAIVLGLAAALPGCNPPAGGPAASPPASSALPPPPPPPPPASPSPSPPALPPTATSATAPTIDLSAGVALAQTGPEGTMMGFSVDYRFTHGAPAPGRTYYWVITTAQGPIHKQPVQLEPGGNLMLPVAQLRPEAGPFESHIEDEQGNRLSAAEPMR